MMTNAWLKNLQSGVLRTTLKTAHRKPRSRRAPQSLWAAEMRTLESREMLSGLINLPPIITSSATLSVDENITAAGTVTAIDPELAALDFSIVGGDDAALFAIDTVTGALGFQSAPNFEAAADVGANNVYNVRVQVSDGTNNVTQDIAVTVLDLNEPPTVEPKQFLIGENSVNGAFIGTVHASDPDPLQSVTFSITAGNTDDAFAIDPSSGVLTVNNSAALNYEAVTQFDLTVTATDNGIPFPESGSATVTVFLRDVNETPVVQPKQFLIGENSLNGAFIGTVKATDPDAGQTKTFTIVAGNTSSAFAINPSTGVLTVNNSAALNYESIKQFDLTVRVVDNGSPAKAGYAAVTVFLRDVNEAPVVSNKPFLISENSVNGAFIGTVKVTDPDAGQTRTFDIVAGNTNNAFAIDPSTGVLSVNNSAALNFEKADHFDLTVKVTDNGSPAKAGSAVVTVFLRDVNEAPVVSTKPFLISENSVNGAFIGTVKATDPEVNQTRTFAITAGNINNAFAIDAATGVLTVNNSAALDYETITQFDLTIAATDNGVPAQTGSATVTVFLRDVPDDNVASGQIRESDTTTVVLSGRTSKKQPMRLWV